MTKPEGFPDFFLVGAPRCGTTSVSRYLARNPQICFSRPKEPHYFAQLNHDPDASELKHNYLDRYFHHRTQLHRVVGEGSVSYLFLPHTLERICQINPEVRFIALVRNPIKSLPSYHLRMQFLLQEDEPDFEKAWNLQAQRARGEMVPKHCMDTRLLMYSEGAMLGFQVERLFGIVGRDRSLVIVFDDLMADPLGVYRRTLEFLGVEDDGQTRFDQNYGSHIYRYRWLQKLFAMPAMHAGKLIDSAQRRKRKYNEDGSKRPSLIKRITDFNKVPATPAPLTPRMAETVRDFVQSDIQLLSQLLGRDLSYWLSR